VSTDLDLKKLLARCERAFGTGAPQDSLSKVRAIVGSESSMPPTEEGKLAVEGLQALKNGQVPTPAQLSALQFLIRLTRPVPFVHRGRPDDLPTADHVSLFPEWPAFQQATSCLPLIGRVDRVLTRPTDTEIIGTGIIASPSLLLTNQHVLAQLSRGTMQLEKGQGIVRFGWEDQSFAPIDPIAITGVAAVHPTLDAALLQLERMPASAAAIPAFDTGAVDENTDIVVVGYPADDPVRNPMFIRNIYGTKTETLRASPGQCVGSLADGFYHDCTTLGGNSGSPVFVMATGKWVGLHSGGRFLWKNEAIGGASLAAFLQR
jgi:hypothetical protein